jgi:hypothetical protein
MMPTEEFLEASWAYTETASCYLAGYAIAQADQQEEQHEPFGVALEVCGTKSAVTELFRHARRGHAVSIVVNDGISWERWAWRAPRAGARYAALTAPLGNGAVHGILLHPQATTGGVLPEEPFFVVAPADARDSRIIQRFGDGLAAATILPLLPGWAGTLWSAGWDAGLIETITCGGTLVAYRVRGETGRWAPVVERLVLEGKLLAPAEAEA